MNFQDSITLKSKEVIYKNDPNITTSDQKSSYKKPREFLESLIVENSDRKPSIQTKPQYEDKHVIHSKPHNEEDDELYGVQSMINALRNAQTKNKQYFEENDRLKHEISNLQTQLEFKENIFIDFQTQLSQYDSHKNELIVKIQSLSKNNELMDSLLKMAEREKTKHLEQSAIEKEELLGKIKNLTSELDNAKKLFADVSKENKKLREDVFKAKGTILNYENTVVKKLKEEIAELKDVIEIKNDEYRRNIEEINEKNDKEKESLLMKIYAMKEMINSLSNQGNNMKRHYDKQIREIKNDEHLQKENKNTLFNKSVNNFKKNDSQGYKTKIFTNKNYTGNESKSLFKYLLRSKSLDKHSFLENSKVKKTYESAKGEIKMTTPYRSKVSESISNNNEKQQEAAKDKKVLIHDLKPNAQFESLNKSYDNENGKESLSVNTSPIIEKEINEISNNILIWERKIAELNRKSQNSRIKYNVYKLL